jgi:uncharacterized lipoprotein YajG
MPFRAMTKSEMLERGFTMGRSDTQNTRVEVYRVGTSLKESMERNAIMQEIIKLAWIMNIKSKESKRINWHFARRFKETNTQLEKLLADMKIEYVYQQAGGVDE